MAMLLPILVMAASMFGQEVGGMLREIAHFDPDPGDVSGCEVAAGGDCDADGVPDFALRFRGVGRVEVRSGSSHAVLWTVATQIEFSIGSLAFVHDVDRDGKDELAVGSRYQDRVTLYSGADGSILWTRAEPILNGFGAGVDAGGDMTGDGIADVVVHAPDANDPLTAYNGACVILSGVDGSIAHLLYLGTNYTVDLSGRQIAAAGDVDLDGREDFVVGKVMQAGVPASTRLFSGATASLIRSLSIIPAIGFGSSVANAGDVNEDGVPDQLIADSQLSTIYCFSGADGAELWRTRIIPETALLGVGLSGCRDCDGDGIPDVVAGAPFATQVNPRFYGSVFGYSGANGDMLWRLNGSVANRIGRTVASLGDADSNEHPKVLIDGNSLSPSGWTAARIVEWYPGLRADSDRLSVQRGGRIEFQSRWPLDLAGARYVLLASGRGDGPTMIGGLAVPLTPDAWTARILQRNAPALSGAMGRLDARATASPVLEVHPGSASSLLGSTLWFSLVVGVSGQPVAASISRTLTFIP